MFILKKYFFVKKNIDKYLITVFAILKIRITLNRFSKFL